ncbi:pyruvate, phosphate dikinase [Fusobacterium sp.]|uniref:pyruvate, phosphate dikinase n=1 Tax=Fusobacterium sp. TaxID=68766 RepID=UPI00396C4E22
MKKVYSFNEGNKSMINLLGGKGGNLAEMTKIGLPIPEGIIISTEACKDYYKDGQKISAELEKEILVKLEELQKQTGKNFGGKNPLLVSVRSGAPISMPGMMDTILNLGLNDETAKHMIDVFKDEDFVYQSYYRFIQMFSEIVMGIDKDIFFKLKKEMTESKDYSHQKLIQAGKEKYKEITGKEFPEEPKEQLFLAINAIFKSWNNERAKVYRKIHKIDDNLGTAVVVQQMVFGNLNEKSGTGVAFTRDPSSGENHIFGEYLLKAQGEDIVAGIRTPEPIEKLKDQLPEIYKEFVVLAKKLENHNKDMQDIEFTIEDGKLYLLQTRNGKRSPYAAVRIAVEMVEEGLLTKEEAIMKVDAGILPQLLHGNFKPEAIAKATLLGKGLPGSAGVAIGRVMFSSEKTDTRAMTILVREETSPEDIKGISIAEGIVTVKGGVTSHGAVVARGMGKCCVTGCGAIKINDIKKEMYIGGYTVKEGAYISISGYTGEIYLGKVELSAPQFDDNLKKFVKWCQDIKRLKVRMNADTPADAKLGKSFGAEGIGLCRTEHMFFPKDKIWTIRQMILSDNPKEVEAALNKMHQMQKDDFISIFKVVEEGTVIVRLLDPPLHEFLPKEPKDKQKMAEILGVSLEEIERRIVNLKDANPMLGHRGCRLAVTRPELYNMQTRAIIEAAVECVKAGFTKLQPEIMLPLIIGAKELQFIKANIEAEIKKVLGEHGVEVNYKIGTMMETPRACLLADEIARDVDFFSFGTNDLTQTTMGLSRDDSVKFMTEYYQNGILKVEPFATIDERGVGKLVKLATELGRKTKPEIEIGICGEHGGDPQSIDFFESVKLDYVSCSPFRVLVAIVAAAQAKLKQYKGIDYKWI